MAWSNPESNPDTKQRGRSPFRAIAVGVSAATLMAMGSIGIGSLLRDSNGVSLGPQLVEFVPSGVTRSVDCVAALRNYVKDVTFLYAPNEWQLADTNKVQAIEIAAKVDACPEAILYVYGHADGTGNDELNSNISRLRAQDFLQFVAEVDTDGDGYGDFETVRYRLHGQAAFESVFEGDSGDEDQVLNRRLRFEAHYLSHSDYARP